MGTHYLGVWALTWLPSSHIDKPPIAMGVQLLLHNCDEMGCSSVNHTIARIPATLILHTGASDDSATEGGVAGA